MPYASLAGFRLYYDAFGTGQPVVFLHGHTLDRRLWDGLVAPVAQRYRMIRLDLRGHGRSDAPAGAYSPLQFAADLHAMADALALARPAIVGHSVGGVAALEFALTWPDRLSALVLIASGVEGQAPSPKLAEHMRRQGESFARLGHSQAWIERRLEGMVYSGVPDLAGKQAKVRAMLRAWSGASREIFAPAPPRPGPSQRDRLAEIRVPALILVGAQDGRLFHRHADVLAAGIPNARKAVVPEAGHLPPLENPAAVAQLLAGFLDESVPGGPATAARTEDHSGP